MVSKIALFDLDRTLFRCNISFDYYWFLIKKRHLASSSIPECLLTYLKHKYLDLPLISVHEKAFEAFLFSRAKEFFTHHLEEYLSQILPSHFYMPAYYE